MKKIFLLGTMLGVASAALAFGGMFNHGSKSTTYKGGVSAIGVHFGGDKKEISLDGTTSEKELIPCPNGTLRDRQGFCDICENGNLYFSYRDDPCGEDTDVNKTTCASGADCDSGCCSDNGYCTVATYWWDEELHCLPEEGKTCRNNNECETGEFCNLNYEYVQTNLDEDGNSMLLGVCTPIGGRRNAAYNDKVFVQGEKELAFMGALNWCHALGLEMATSEDLGLDPGVVCSPWGENCPDIDFSPFQHGEWDTFQFWLNDGMRFNSEGNYEEFKYILKWSSGLNIGWSDSVWEDPMCHNPALCVLNCPNGTYAQNGKCVQNCGPYEYVGEQNVCMCQEGFVWGEQTCGCPKDYYLSGNTCVECPEDETNPVGNTNTSCAKVQCHYPTAVTPVRFHYCCESDELDRYCVYYDDGECECAH